MLFASASPPSKSTSVFKNNRPLLSTPSAMPLMLLTMNHFTWAHISTANDQGLDLQDVNVVAHDTTEFWFVKTGVMYEVITIKGDEAWLVKILKTWQFN
jgi:hypothetical protein